MASGSIQQDVWNMRGLTVTDKMVLLKLARCASEDLMAWPSKRTIAMDCGIQPRTVLNSLNRLERQRFIVTVEERIRKPTVYRLNMSAIRAAGRRLCPLTMATQVPARNEFQQTPSGESTAGTENDIPSEQEHGDPDQEPASPDRSLDPLVERQEKSIAARGSVMEISGANRLSLAGNATAPTLKLAQRLAFELLDRVPAFESRGDLEEALKRSLAQKRIAYDGRLVATALNTALASRGLKPWWPRHIAVPARGEGGSR